MVWKENLLVDDDPNHYESFKRFWELDYNRPQDLFLALIHYLPGYCGGPEERFDFPKHFVFANIQCLRCGLCCKNYEGADIVGDLESQLIEDRKGDLLQYMWFVGNDEFKVGSTVPTIRGSCTLCRKVTGKPYYSCRINEYKEYLPTCRDYLCSKSIPVANLSYKDVDELIDMIGLQEYHKLIETDWGEEFDWSASYVKTH